MQKSDGETIRGRVFNIQRCSLHDGPGIRTTAFLKGCSLRCAWCQNPEGLTREKNLTFDSRKCISCKTCHGISDPETLAKVCPTGAKSLVGEDYTPEELTKKLLLDRDFYGDNGGVTFSGGECLLQSDFVAACARMLKSEKINIAADTCGMVDFSAFEKVLSYTDLFLYDIKTVFTDKHREYTGVGNEKILGNFVRLYETGARIWVRIPIVGHFNDTLKEARTIRDYLDGFPRIEKIETLRYHELGRNKYTLLGLSYPLGDEAKVDPNRFDEISAILSKNNEVP